MTICCEPAHCYDRSISIIEDNLPLLRFNFLGKNDGWPKIDNNYPTLYITNILVETIRKIVIVNYVGGDLSGFTFFGLNFLTFLIIEYFE